MSGAENIRFPVNPIAKLLVRHFRMDSGTVADRGGMYDPNQGPRDRFEVDVVRPRGDIVQEISEPGAGPCAVPAHLLLPSWTGRVQAPFL